ncbi:hypothetical protein BpHYR1_012834 [Brachionus plicatilis]|uniref:Uncharacterized protein n=1 Tax=Brachionus plicatilis TaxID=10195 RepID=A0A3M7PT64_BRAPC|nr:hypothetical protein BpHYR1_012834 [Brachionus plicatilis]
MFIEYYLSSFWSARNYRRSTLRVKGFIIVKMFLKVK